MRHLQFLSSDRKKEGSHDEGGTRTGGGGDRRQEVGVTGDRMVDR